MIKINNGKIKIKIKNCADAFLDFAVIAYLIPNLYDYETIQEIALSNTEIANAMENVVSTCHEVVRIIEEQI